MSITVHHLSCGTLCPFSRRLVNGEGGWLEPGHLCCHVLLLETEQGLVLVDTGMGEADLSQPSRLPAFLRWQLGLQMDAAHSALAQIRELGLDPADVRHILLTHLDFDHAGGLTDFPQAQVHLHLREREAAMARRSFMEKQRYLPTLWQHAVDWRTHAPEGEAWEGFAAARAIPELGEDILLIPLHGHTQGHSGIAVRGDKGWLLHCGDAYFHHGEMEQSPHGPAGLLGYERLIAMDDQQRRENQYKLRELRSRRSDLRLFCAHDPDELNACQQA